MPAKRTRPPAPPVELPPESSSDTFRRQPRQPRGQKRVDLLLDAAATVIARNGLEGATAEAIAQEARTAKGSLYQFFPNRDAVLAALALRYADELRAIHERTIPLDPHALSLEKLIERVVRPLADFHDRNPAFRRVFGHAEAASDETRKAPARLNAQLFESFVDRLDVVFAARNLALTSRERRRIALTSASIGQVMLANRARAAAADKKAILDDLRRLLLAYLQPLLEPAATRPRRTGTRPGARAAR
jgi:AcrR family transcriptional regulator